MSGRRIELVNQTPEERVYELASLGCKKTDIAKEFLGISVDTFDRKFAEHYTKGRENLKNKLRQAQIDSALNGNVVMLIWLGKQLLGQQDSTRVDLGKIPDDMLIEEAQKRLSYGSE